LGRLQTGSFMTLGRRLLSDTDVRLVTGNDDIWSTTAVASCDEAVLRSPDAEGQLSARATFCVHPTSRPGTSKPSRQTMGRSQAVFVR
jgi:hypothetical protein